MDLLEVTDITTEMGTLATYILALAAVIISAYGFKFGFKAAWKALKTALHITTSPASGK